MCVQYSDALCMKQEFLWLEVSGGGLAWRRKDACSQNSGITFLPSKKWRWIQLNVFFLSVPRPFPSCVSSFDGPGRLIWAKQEECHCHLPQGFSPELPALGFYVCKSRSGQRTLYTNPNYDIIQQYGVFCWLQAQGTVPVLLQLWAGQEMLSLTSRLLVKTLAQPVGRFWGMTYSAFFSTLLLRLHNLFEGAFDLAVFPPTHLFQLSPLEKRSGSSAASLPQFRLKQHQPLPQAGVKGVQHHSKPLLRVWIANTFPQLLLGSSAVPLAVRNPQNKILWKKCCWKCVRETAFWEKMHLKMSAFCKRGRKKTVRIYVALLSKIEQPKPVLSCQKLKTLFFGLNILVFKFSLENAMFTMENVESKLLFFSPLLKSTFTSSLLKRTPPFHPGCYDILCWHQDWAATRTFHKNSCKKFPYNSRGVFMRISYPSSFQKK